MRTMVRLPLFVGVFALALAGQAQAQTPYVLTYSTQAYAPVGGGVTYSPTAYAFGYEDWDEGAVQVPLPFGFAWYGNTYNSVYVFTNGLISFDPPPVAGGPAGILRPPATVPDPTGTRHNYVAPMWADLTGVLPTGTVTGEIRAVPIGTAPNRTLIIQVSGLKRSQNPTSDANFQVWFEEGSSAVTIIWGGNTGISGATVGIENDTGQQGTNLLEMPTNCGSCQACMPRRCGSVNFPSGTTLRLDRPPVSELIAGIRGPRGAYPGDAFNADINVSNIGQSPTPGFDVEIRLSMDTIIDATDMLLTSINYPIGLDIGTSTASVVALTMPMAIPTTNFYLGIIVDSGNTVTEAIETNNAAYDPGGIVSGPDLVATINGPLASGPGEFIDVDLVVRSIGAPVSTSVDVEFFLSDNAVVDGNDISLGTQSFLLPDGFTLAEQVELLIPANTPPSPPSYRLLALVDPMDTIDETIDLNNTAVAAQVLTLSAPDLQANGLDVADFGFRGMPYPVTAAITNVGGTTARNFSVCVLISRNQLISLLADPILARTASITLDAGDTANIRLEPLVPTMTPTGAWYLAVAADCDQTLAENLETNNVARTPMPITIRDPAPDFSPVQIDSSTAAAAGEALAVAVTVANLGNVASMTTVRLVISANAGPTINDTLLWETPAPVMLDPSRETIVSAWAPLPAEFESGNYYIGAIVDPTDAVEEVREDNNVIATDAIAVIGADLAIVGPSPANAVIGVPYAWRFVALGGPAGYSWSINWASGSAPGGITFDGVLGELSGTPLASAEGAHDLTVTVNSGGASATRSYRLLITPPTLPLTVVTAKLPPALEGEGFSVELVAVGGTPPYEWYLETGSALPPGLRLTQGGIVGGEPMGVGAYTFEVQVVDSSGAFTTGLIAVDVIDPAAGVSITTADIPSGTVGMVYRASFDVTGGVGPYTWRLTADPIPGIAFVSGEPAMLVGTATIAGVFPLIIEVRDSQGLLDRNAYVLEIFELGDLVITSGSDEDPLPKAQVGAPFAREDGMQVNLRVVRRSGQSAPTDLRWSIPLGDLPPGLSLDGNTGLIAGTPTAEGVFAFTAFVHDGSGDFDRQTLAIQVAAATVVIPGGDDGSSCGCSAAGSRDGVGWSWAVVIVLGLLALRGRGWAMLAALLVAALAVPSTAKAQTVPYQVITQRTPFVPLTNGTRVDPPLGDGDVVQLDLPFDFNLYGANHRRIWINANGLVSVTQIGPGHHFPTTNNPSRSTPNGFIAGLWSDWCAQFGGACSTPAASPDTGIYYRIDTIPGDEKIVIEFRALRHFQDVTAASAVTFQIVLHGGLGGQIDLNYGDVVVGTNFNNNPVSFGGRIGIEAASGNEGMWVGPCSGSSSCNSAQVQSLSGQRIRILIDAGDDISVAGVSTPSQAYPGLPLPVTARYVSRHGDPLGPTEFAAVLVPQSTTSTRAGIVVYNSAPITLAPYEARLLSFNAEVPENIPPGHYRMAIVADSQHALVETDETNNVVFGAHIIRIAGRAPDFTVRRVRLDRVAASPGDAIQIAYTAENAGNEPGTMLLRAYASSNTAITTSDVELGMPVTTALMSRETTTGTIAAMLPATLPSGRYYIGIIVDPLGAVAELDETNNVGGTSQVLDVTSGQVAIVTNSLPVATLTLSYSGRIEAIGGDGTFTFRLTDGMLPRGMIFNADQGEIFGIPLEVGSFPLQFEARSAGRSNRKTVDFTVVQPQVPLTIVTRTLPDALAGSDYAVTPLTVGGVEPLVWRVVGSLPRGLALATNGTIIGTPVASGLANFGLQVRDNMSATASVTLSLQVRAPSNLSVVSGRLGETDVGSDYQQALFATGGVEPYTWSAQGTLPPGLVLADNGTLTGIPERVGAFRFVVQVQDALTSVDTNTLTLDVLSAGRFLIVTNELPATEPDTDYKAVIVGGGGQTPYSWSLVQGEGSLPPGITGRTGIGTLEGETDDDFVLTGRLPVDEGVWAFTIRLEDNQGRTVDKPYALVSKTPAPPPTMATDSGGCRCVAPRSRGGLWSIFAIALVVSLRRRRRT